MFLTRHEAYIIRKSGRSIISRRKEGIRRFMASEVNIAMSVEPDQYKREDILARNTTEKGEFAQKNFYVTENWKGKMEKTEVFSLGDTRKMMYVVDTSPASNKDECVFFYGLDAVKEYLVEKYAEHTEIIKMAEELSQGIIPSYTESMDIYCNSGVFVSVSSVESSVKWCEVRG